MHHLQFETTVAVVMGFVLVVGVALIGLLQVAEFLSATASRPRHGALHNAGLMAMGAGR